MNLIWYIHRVVKEGRWRERVRHLTHVTCLLTHPSNNSSSLFSFMWQVVRGISWVLYTLYWEESWRIPMPRPHLTFYIQNNTVSWVFYIMVFCWETLRIPTNPTPHSFSTLLLPWVEVIQDVKGWQDVCFDSDAISLV